MNVRASTVVAGVVGWPVAQSLSPVIHNAWVATLGLDAVYVAFPVRPDGFARWIDGLREGGVRGLNVTMPFKAQALAAADRASPAARAAGGANTLVFHDDDTLSADSTDGRGVLAAFAEQAPAWRPAQGPVVVLGAGGAGRAAAAVLLAAGAPEVRLLVRDRAKAQGAAVTIGAAVRGLDETSALENVTAVVNATPLGFRGEGRIDLAWSALSPSAVVMDMVSTPLETPLLAEARRRGHAAVDGLAMLIGQARPSFEAFFGVAPPPAAVCDVRGLCLQARGEAGG